MLSCTVLKLSQIIAQILDKNGHFEIWTPSCGLRGKIHSSSWAHWKACSGLRIRVNCTFFARCYKRILMQIGI